MISALEIEVGDNLAGLLGALIGVGAFVFVMWVLFRD